MAFKIAGLVTITILCCIGWMDAYRLGYTHGKKSLREDKEL